MICDLTIIAMMATSNSDDFDEVTSKFAGAKLSGGVTVKKIKKVKPILPIGKVMKSTKTSKIPIGGKLMKLPKISKMHRRFRWIIESPILFNDIISLSTINEGDEGSIGSTLCRKCGISFCQKNSTICSDCVMKQENSVLGIPKSLVIMRCVSCQSYSFTGKTEFFSAPPRSATLLRFLIRRISLHLYRLRLSLISASFLPTKSGRENIRLGLMLEEEFSHGRKSKKRHIVDFVVDSRSCCTCSNIGTAEEWKSVVKLRQFGNGQQGLVSLLIGIPRRAIGCPVKKCVPVSNGVDFFFANDIESNAFYDLLGCLAPLRPAALTKTADESCIDAVMCPFSYGDLLYIGYEDMASWGFSGSVAICTGVSSSITFLDPFTLKRRTLSAVEYWGAPFEPLKTTRDLMEYLVLDVHIISRENPYALADVEVARFSDFGKRDVTSIVRTFLGYLLKPGDHALGYDLCDIQSSSVGTGKTTKLLPDVVLVKKKTIKGRVQMKKTSPEYEEFLRNLDQNPEALFNLSLNNDNNSENQQSVKPEEKSDFDLEGLLADLHLGGVENVDAPTNCD